MNTETVSVGTSTSGNLEKWAFYIFLATIFLVPLAFLPTPYIGLNLVKTVVIAGGTIISAFLYVLLGLREKSFLLPSRAIVWSTIVVAISVALSSLMSGAIAKSFFGQGFEIGTGSLVLVFLLDIFLAVSVIRRDQSRLQLIYAAIGASFGILAIFHILRFIFGSSFAKLSILSSLTSTVYGSWSSLGAYALLITLAALLAACLPISSVSRKTRVWAWIIAVVSAIIAACIDGSTLAWSALSLTILALTIARFVSDKHVDLSIVRRIPWVFLVIFLISGLFAFKGSLLVNKPLSSVGGMTSELVLPWQPTLDVAAGAIKDSPLFGVGPNRFAQAYIQYKPTWINATDFWGIEFNSGFAVLPTFIATQGIVGLVAWVLLLVFLGIILVKSLRRISDDDSQVFSLISTAASVIFGLLLCLIIVPPHALLFYVFVLVGLFVGIAIESGVVAARDITPSVGSASYRRMPMIVGIVLVVIAVWGLIYVKKSIALTYFGAGVKQLNTSDGSAQAADGYFARALSIDSSDIYWQARTEASIAEANRLVASVTSTTAASTSQAVLTQVNSLITQGLTFSTNGINFDPTSYYNYVSQARVAEAAAALRMDKAYETGVAAYTAAIRRNPNDPSLYLALARLQTSQNKLDDALQTIGAALQVKNNYVEAVFLLSQVQAAKGNLSAAITAATVATQLTPRSQLAFFQLGLLDYNAAKYSDAASAFETALSIQKDYANATYFLGLSYARLGRTKDAIVQFENLTLAYPDNQDVKTILSNLRAGKSLFGGASTSAPEKRSTLPVKQK